MLAVLVGLPLGFLSFLIATRLSSGFLGAGLPLVIGIVAGFVTWYVFKAMDKRRLQKLLNPPDVIWPVDRAIAWAILKDAFDGPLILAGQGTLVPWRINKEDRSRGLLIASLDLRELLQRDRAVEEGSLTVNARVKDDGDQTAVSLTYYATGEQAPTEQVIRLTEQWLQEDLERAFLQQRGSS